MNMFVLGERCAAGHISHAPILPHHPQVLFPRHRRDGQGGAGGEGAAQTADQKQVCIPDIP